MISQRIKIRKMGNSHGILIPQEILKSMQWEAGQFVDLILELNALVLAKPVPTLNDLVNSVPKKMKIKEVSTGRPVGKEKVD